MLLCSVCFLWKSMRPRLNWTPTDPLSTNDLRFLLWTPTYPLSTIDLRSLIWTLICLFIWLLLLTTTMSVPIDKKCCVPNCGKTRLDGTILHNFPNYEKEPERFRTWLYAIGGDLLVLDNKIICNNRRVCHNHFQPWFYTSSKRLCANAVPTLNLPGFQITRRPLQEVSNINVENIHQAEPTQEVEPFLINPSCSRRFPITTRPCQEVSNMDVENISQAAPSQEVEPLPSDPSCSWNFPKLKQQHSSLTSKYRDETSLLRQQLVKLRNCKDSYAAKLKKAMNLTENTTFQNSMKNFNSAARTLLMMQFKHANKRKFGRRYTKKEKILSLAFYKMGPRAYRWFRNILALPAPVTLSRMISTAGLKTGINDCIFSSLKKRAAKMTDEEKLCVLLFDEMALSPHFDYSKRMDQIKGFVDNGKATKRKIADHVLVFMVRGIQKNYKQAIYYTFTSGSTPKYELKMQIKEVINKLQSTGLNIVATICDQGASNVSAIKELVNDTKEIYIRNNEELRNNIFEINGKEIVPLFDTPHLLKGIRNNMLSKNLICDIQSKSVVGKWEHIISLYKEDPSYKNLKFLPRLTEHHVFPEKIKKMKVKCAAQVFSASVAMYMGYLAGKKILPESSQDTADILLFFDQLFDSLNGSYGNLKKKQWKTLLRPVTPKSDHHKIWSEAIKVLRSMKFVDGQNRNHIVPSIKNWIWTLQNFQHLAEKLLRDHNLKSFWMRNFNQDPLENFFGSIRSHGIRNVNPTCAGFEVAFAAVLVNNISSHSRGSNCEADTAQNMLFKSMKKIFFHKKKTSNCDPVEVDFDDVSDQVLVGFEIKTSNPKALAILEYVTGYIIKKARAKIFKTCVNCKNNLLTNDTNESSYEYIKLKEISKKQNCLTYPKREVVEMFSNIQDIVTYILKKKSEMLNIKSYIKTLITVHCCTNFINCASHKEKLIKYIIELSCNMFICHWCKDTNKILSGMRSDVSLDDDFQASCLKYFIKRKK